MNVKFNNEVGFQNRTDKELGEIPFTRMDNRIIDDNRLNYLEKMIMIDILRHPIDWIIMKGYFQSRSGFGRKKFNKSWAKLVELKYITEEKLFGGWRYSIDEAPTQCHKSVYVNKEQLLTTKD